MLKRGASFFVVFLCLSVLIGNVVTAEDIGATPTVGATPEATSTSEVTPSVSPAGDANAEELKYGAGITPDSNFYFVEKYFLERFRGDLDNREKKVAEIREMVKDGKYDSARIALERYKDYAQNVEKEITPEDKDKAERSSSAIRKAITEVGDKIPKEEKKEFVDDIVDKEKKIENAAQIASKIKELCEQLSKLDPNEYERVCRVEGENAPRWQRQLDKKLTDEQKSAAKKFSEIMSECFKTQGKECHCSELNEFNKPFADKCSIVAPLAAKCDGGDESSCEAMNEATKGIEDLLPDYLQEVFANLQGNVQRDQFEFHMPKECRDAGAKTPKECMKVMFETHAPEECLQALKDGKISFDNEREARKACEKIMFETHAPEECVKAGATDSKECGKLIFKEKAPPECIDAGLTGENREDSKKCEEIMRSKNSENAGGQGGFGRGVSMDCKRIENSEERLKCYDKALEGVGNDNGEFGNGQFGNSDKRFENREGNNHAAFPKPCVDAGATTPEDCRKVMNEFGQKQRQGFEQGQEQFKEGTLPPAGQCSSGQSWKCVEGRCGCVGSEQPPVPAAQPLPEQRPPVTETKPIETNPATPPAGTETTPPPSSGTAPTGGVIQIDNRFIDYYYGN